MLLALKHSNGSHSILDVAQDGFCKRGWLLTTWGGGGGLASPLLYQESQSV